MDMGTWGEWFGGTATAAATVVALYFGVRDNEEAKLRHQRRSHLRNQANDMLRRMERWDAGVGSSDGERLSLPEMDYEASELVAYTGQLGTLRRWWARRLLSSIYGGRSVKVALLWPERAVWRDNKIHSQSFTDRMPKEYTGDESLNEMLLRTRPDLVTASASPLRIAGAKDDMKQRRRLRRRFEQLARL